MEKQGERDCKGSSTSIAKTKFERVLEKAQEKKENVTSSLLKLKVTTHGFKALAQEKKEMRMKEQEELLNKVDKVTLPTKKGNLKRTSSEEIYKELEKELKDLGSLKDEVVKPSKGEKEDHHKKKKGFERTVCQEARRKRN